MVRFSNFSTVVVSSKSLSCGDCVDTGPAGVSAAALVKAMCAN